jgi:hypothetical protein
MNNRNAVRYVSGLALSTMLGAVMVSNGCSAASGLQAGAQGCDGLDLHAEAQLSVHEWVLALQALDTATSGVEAKWLKVCNEINKDLKLDTSKTTASDACGVLKAYIAAEKATLTIVLTVQPPVCEADLSVEADCQAQCTVAANCDVKASCQPGQLVVDCSGTCDAECDVTAPSFQCMGVCKGECTAGAAVMCQGECSGTCDAACNGTCDGKNSTGMCQGTCVGTCGGMCTGKCTVAAGAMCSGTCNGTCAFTAPQAMCKGQCHGMCTGTASPPTCTGQLNCQAAANCQASCHARASASLNCSPPQTQLTVTGDDNLLSSFQSHLDEIGTAMELTFALRDPIANVAGQTATTLGAVGSVGLAGAKCFADQAQTVTHVQASISVSVSASLTVQGQ